MRTKQLIALFLSFVMLITPLSVLPVMAEGEATEKKETNLI